jgi:hypothetical protein
MTTDDIRVRSRYLYLTCSQVIERFKDRLVASLPPAVVSATPLLDRILRKELGLLVRYWATREIWRQWESQEWDAKQLNLELLRLFVEGVRLSQDGSGLRYAELSGAEEEAQELTHRIAHAIGVDPGLVLSEVEGTILPGRDAVLRYTAEALHQPPEELSRHIQAWTQRSPASEGVRE